MGARNTRCHVRPAAAAAALSLSALLATGCTTAVVDLPAQDAQEDALAEEEQVIEDAPAPEAEESEEEAEKDVEAEEESAAEEAPEEEAEPEPVPLRETLDLSTLDFNAIPTAGELTTFSLAQTAAPDLSAESRAAIESAIQSAQRLGNVSVILMSCNTGAGIAYSTDTSVYGASSFKGPYVAYLCRELVETGQLSLASTCTVFEYDPFFSGTYGHVGATYSFQNLAEATVRDSDNDAFRILHMNYDSLGYYDWLDRTFGAGTLPRVGYFPHVSARIMAKAWAYVWGYLGGGSETAAWLSGLYANTSVSFIRDALASAGADATVYNKAGWYGGDPQYNSTTDAGIVQIDGSTYLVAAVSNMSYGDSSAAALEGVIQAVFSAREALG